jgi:hypothetical protein
MEYNMIQSFKDRGNDLFCAAVMVTKADTEKELSDDFILPDYLPDIKKIVRTEACPRLGNRFLGSGMLEYEGAVAYKVLYIADDNSVRCAAFLCDFKNKIVGEELNEDCVDVLRPVTASLVCRMQNPRKLNIRCKAGVTGAIWQRNSFLPELYGARGDEEKSIETKENQIDALNITNHRESGLVFSEDITLDSSHAPIGDIICSSAEIYVDECRSSGNELLLRGVCEFELLYSHAEGEAVTYSLLRKSLPFSQALDAEQMQEGVTCTAIVLPESCNVNVREDEFGKRRMVELDLGYALDICALVPKKMYFCSDCYSVQKECQTTMLQKNIWRLMDSSRTSFSVNENKALKEIEGAGIKEVKACYIHPTLAYEETNANKRPVFTGVAKVNVLGLGEDAQYKSISFELPLRLVAETSLYLKEHIFEQNCRAENIRCRVDDEKLYVDFEIICHTRILGGEEITAVQVIRMTGETLKKSEKGAVATLYFPEKGETLFDIAKKYKVTSADLMARNGLDSIELTPGHALLIGQKR